jgi:YD repeat-containing protein
VTSYTYDELNRVVSETNQQGTVRQYAYDAEGEMTERTDRLGLRTAFGHQGIFFVDRFYMAFRFIPLWPRVVNLVIITPSANKALSSESTFGCDTVWNVSS